MRESSNLREDIEGGKEGGREGLVIVGKRRHYWCRHAVESFMSFAVHRVYYFGAIPNSE